MANTYKWKPHFNVAGTSAQTIGDHLEKIREKNRGFLTPQQVVKHAKAKKSPLHECFEWEDSIAATAYREDQARYVLRSLVVVINEDTSDQKTVRAFVAVTQNDDSGYTSLAHAMSDDELRVQVVRRAWNELEAWRRRYEDYDELAKIFAVIDRQKVE